MAENPPDRPESRGIQSVQVNCALLQQLESLQAAGVRQLPHSESLCSLGADVDAQTAPAIRLPADLPGTTATLSNQGKTKPQDMKSEVPLPSSSAATLEVLREEVSQCMRCQELAGTRTQTVFGVGDPQARLCIVGEAPGMDEDRQGEPFVGRAGQLLDKILAACQLERDAVYILNVLKCRPPGNRNPTPEEACQCRPFLERQLQLIRPEFICCMGAVAAQNLLATTTPIGRLRGKIHDYQGIRVICTYHPAYLLRTPAAKAKTWEDMKLLMREMGVELG
jgi:DNA polymerase